MSETQTQRLHAYVEGFVQGVGFRYYVLRSAQANNLAGWVRNRHDGRVEVMAEGELNQLNQLLNDLRKGPLSSDVEKVDYEFLDVQSSEGQDEFRGFKVLSTA